VELSDIGKKGRPREHAFVFGNLAESGKYGGLLLSVGGIYSEATWQEGSTTGIIVT
jgi:hypothetical protein